MVDREKGTEREKEGWVSGSMELSNKVFSPYFFPYSNLPGPLTSGLKYFRFWLRF